jgi:hypothetical protein
MSAYYDRLTGRPFGNRCTLWRISYSTKLALQNGTLLHHSILKNERYAGNVLTWKTFTWICTNINT